jgi:hypothetical protein
MKENWYNALFTKQTLDRLREYEKDDKNGI